MGQGGGGTERVEGLFTLYVDRAGGRVLMRLPAPAADGSMGRAIHHTALRTGVGSALTGLDRAQIGATNVLTFRRIGKKIVAEFENPKYRAPNGGPEEQAAARDAFLGSTVWAGEPVATAPDGSVVIDVTGFVTRDAHGVADQLKRTGQGAFRPVADLTLVDPAAAKAFPDNVELEARLTFASDEPGPVPRQIAPEPRLVSLTVRHSFIRLPDDGFQTRKFDPRTGAFNMTVTDYSTPLGEPLVTRLAQRFRLEKTNPGAARSTVKKPIVFYVDRAAPEPIRSALVEGASWWADAFDKAGYVDAFKVEVLPEGVDPLDARYNVINWVNRATRSWSYGQSVVDPRTGEIVKGSVLLGSLRVRQDMIIFEGLLGADATGKGGPNDPQKIALDRIRQLSAHEVGHAIGLLHNMAGSTQGRTSVMDYPVPLIRVDGDRLDFSDAYARGVGDWDRFAIDWLYGEADQATLDRKAAEGSARLRFVTDEDIPNGHPWGGHWDNGADPVAELDHVMRVRRIALDRFGLNSLPAGSAVNDLRRRLVPIWLWHRYQVDVTAKQIGGVEYAYSVKGDGREASSPVPADRQRTALDALLRTVSPAELEVREELIRLLDSQQSGDDDPQHAIEVFRGRTGRTFDPGAAADAAARVTFSALFAPERLNRLADAGRRDPAALGLTETLDRTFTAVFAPAQGRLAEPSRRAQATAVTVIAEAQRGKGLSSSAAAIVDDRLKALAQRLSKSRAADPAQRAHDRWLAALLTDRERMDQLLAEDRHDTPVPPGPPIGAELDWFGDEH